MAEIGERPKTREGKGSNGAAQLREPDEILPPDDQYQRIVADLARREQLARSLHKVEAHETTTAYLRIAKCKAEQLLRDENANIGDTTNLTGEAVAILMASQRVLSDDERRRLIDYSSFKSPSWPG